MPLGEIDEALEIDLGDIDLVRKAHEIIELRDGFLEPGQPKRDARPLDCKLPLHRSKDPNIAHDAGEHVAPAYLCERFWVGRIDRDAQLVKAAVDQLLSLAPSQQCAVGVEQDVGAAVLQVANHTRQRRHHHRFPDAMQHDATGNARELVNDAD